MGKSFGSAFEYVSHYSYILSWNQGYMFWNQKWKNISILLQEFSLKYGSLTLVVAIKKRTVVAAYFIKEKKSLPISLTNACVFVTHPPIHIPIWIIYPTNLYRRISIAEQKWTSDQIFYNKHYFYFFLAIFNFREVGAFYYI